MTWEEAVCLAAREGFARAVLLPARVLSEYAPDAQDRRVDNIDPFALLEGAKSVLVAAMPFDWFGPWPEGAAEVSAYYVFSQKANEAVRRLGEALSGLGAQISDSQRLPLKLLGREAGFGVIGRNCLLRNDAWGSCFALRILVTDIPPQPAPERMPAAECGDCSRCVSACPTGALRGNGRLNADRCIRAHMLGGDPVPEALRAAMGTRYVGCETCQRACPANALIRRAAPEAEPFAIGPLLEGGKPRLEAVAALIGANTARKRRAQAQAALAAGNSGNAGYLPALHALAAHEQPAISEHAKWAIDQLRRESQDIAP